jgi:acyl-CoA reductase-like NAD-dependent aldehyde dehydrogenase
VNIVTGLGETAGDALVRHPGVDMVAFTGSLAVGKQIGKICMDRMIKVHLELGGKDPFVVAEDADLDIAAKAVAWASFLNTGQVCTSTERVYVQKTVYPEFLDKLTAFTKTLTLGPGLDPETDIGPMIGDEYRARVDAQVQDAIKAGATLVTGGRKPEKFKKGWYYEPTVLTDVDRTMRVMRDETFGPVCPVTPYRDFDEAVKMANDTIYGLGAILYTRDPKKVKKFYEGVQAGTIWVNDPLTDNDAGPFGGFKATGGGRELGEEGLEEFRQAKHVHWDFEQTEKAWWYPYGKKKKP